MEKYVPFWTLAGLIVVAAFGVAATATGVARTASTLIGITAVLAAVGSLWWPRLQSVWLKVTAPILATSSAAHRKMKRFLKGRRLAVLTLAEECQIEIKKMSWPRVNSLRQWEQKRTTEMLSSLEPRIDVEMQQDDEEPSVFRLTVHCLHGMATEIWAKWEIHFSASQHWEEGFAFLDETKAVRDGESIHHEIRITPDREPLIPLEAPQDVDVEVLVGCKTLWGSTR